MVFNPDDPRVRKTRRGLQEAFIRLILQKGYDAVSIQDIATEADAARITFYRHYADKEELLTDCLNTLYDDLAQKTEHVSKEALAQGNSPLRVLYDHIEAHEPMYRILFSSRGTHTVLERLRHHLATHAIKGLQAFMGTAEPKIPLDIIAYHAASANIGLAMWWLDHDKPYPAPYMAQISIWISLGGLLRAMGLPEFSLPIPPKPD